MQAVLFDGCNAILSAPRNQDDQIVSVLGEIPVRVGLNGIVSEWRPSPAEIDLIQRGGSLRLYLIGGASPPAGILLEVMDP